MNSTEVPNSDLTSAQLPLEPAPPASASKRKRSVVLLLVALAIAVISVGVVAYVRNRASNETIVENAEVQGAPVPQVQEWNEGRPFIADAFTSPNGTHVFSVEIDPHQQHSCFFTITDKKGQELSVADLFGYNRISCYREDFGDESSFIKWLDDETLAIHEITNVVQFINVNQRSVETFTFDSDRYEIESYSDSLQEWLLKEKVTEGANNRFVIVGKDGTVLKSDIALAVDRPALFSPENNGFLFINRTYSTGDEPEYEKLSSVRISFLSLDSLSLRTVFESEPYPTEGRGCVPEYLAQSAKGEIVLFAGCLTVDKKYLDENDQIRIKL